MSLKNNTTNLYIILDRVRAMLEKVLDTSDATATASDMLSGKTAYVDGEKITGNIPTRTSSNLSASGATVTVPAGHYASQATKDVATTTQATPSVSVNASGLITASATQSEGYVSAGTKSGTKQLTTQAAKTITPSTSNQTAVASGVYTTGEITVGAIPSSYVQPTGTLNVTTNGTHDVKNYASVNVAVSSSPQLQNKTVTPTTSQQSVKADSGYDGLNTVTVNAIPSSYVQPSGTKNITENGNHDVKNYASVSVSVPSLDTSDATAAAGNIESGKTAYANGVKIVGTLTFRTIYTGSSTPSSNIGNEGDIYIVGV